MEPVTQPDLRSEALAFLYGRIDYERNNPMPVRSAGLQLDRMRELLRRIGNPHHELRIVHLAGTKGKGSTAAFVAGILMASGRRTGLYASPHLQLLEERFSVDGMPCSAEQLVDLVDEIRPVVAAMDATNPAAIPTLVGPTFFEITTALAMLHFQRQAVDYAVFEVGMGGRLDSTNICTPQVAVITNISFDHTEQLGNTLSAIAREKAGIIKPQVDVVSGVQDPEPREVVRQVAAQRNCQLYELGRDFHMSYSLTDDLSDPSAVGYVNFEDATSRLEELPLRMLGHHQAANAAIAVAAVRRLGDTAITPSTIRHGLQHVLLPARVEIVRRRPLVILDTAHNVASIEALVETLHPLPIAGKRVLIFAATRGKDILGMLQVLQPCFDEVIFTCYRDNPRSSAPESLAELMSQSAPAATIAASPQEAWSICQTRAAADDLVCITGSFFLAAELRPLLRDD